MDDNDRRCVVILLERLYIWGILGWKRMKIVYFIYIYMKIIVKKSFFLV